MAMLSSSGYKSKISPTNKWFTQVPFKISNKEKVTLKMSGDTIKHVFALIEQKHQENNISKYLIEEAILKLPTQIRVVYKKRNKVISCTAKS